ncbi:hypothetical protein MLTONO_2585 [Mesorhizobium loti]|nr:hypothetical protein MLTONO_2585 [Mesorhizobium loti]
MCRWHNQVSVRTRSIRPSLDTLDMIASRVIANYMAGIKDEAELVSLRDGRSVARAGSRRRS